MADPTDDPIVVLLQRTLAGRASGAVPSADLATAARGRRRRRVALRSGLLGAAALGVAAAVAVPILIAGQQGQPPLLDGPTTDSNPSTSGPAPSRIVQQSDCPGMAVCAAGFMVDDVFYSITCNPVRGELVSDDVVAAGQYDGGEAEVRKVIGVDPDVLVAVRLESDTCDGTAWRMVFPDRERDKEARRTAVCSAAMPDDLAERNDCVDR